MTGLQLFIKGPVIIDGGGPTSRQESADPIALTQLAIYDTLY